MIIILSVIYFIFEISFFLSGSDNRNRVYISIALICISIMIFMNMKNVIMIKRLELHDVNESFSPDNRYCVKHIYTRKDIYDGLKWNSRYSISPANECNYIF